MIADSNLKCMEVFGSTVLSMIQFVAEFGSLTQAQLLDKVRAIQNLAYRLGVEEGRCVWRYYYNWLLWCNIFSKGNE